MAAAGMKSRGKYGIGFFSIFMLGDLVRVISRRFDRDTQSARVLEFRHRLGSRPNLRNADPKEVPLDGGTRIEVKLSINPFEPDGLLYRKNPFSKGKVVKLSSVIAAIAPACDVMITVNQDDEPSGETAAADWLEVKSGTLLNRIMGGEDVDEDDDDASTPANAWDELRELRDENGKLYGRARIDASNQWRKCGLIIVDGLAASKIGSIAGILIGVEKTASRNYASPIVSAPVLASWSSEQATILTAAEIPDAE